MGYGGGRHTDCDRLKRAPFDGQWRRLLEPFTTRGGGGAAQALARATQPRGGGPAVATMLVDDIAFLASDGCAGSTTKNR